MKKALLIWLVVFFVAVGTVCFAAITSSKALGIEEEPVKIGADKVGLAQYAYQKDGKRKFMWYSEQHSQSGATTKLVKAQADLAFWSDPNTVAAHVVQQIADANDRVVKYQGIVNLF